MKNNHHARVLRYLKENGSITQKEAYNFIDPDTGKRCDITRLSAIIFDLRKHHDIRTVMIDGKTIDGASCKFAKYVYVGEEKEV